MTGNVFGFRSRGNFTRNPHRVLNEIQKGNPFERSEGTARGARKYSGGDDGRAARGLRIDAKRRMLLEQHNRSPAVVFSVLK